MRRHLEFEDLGVEGIYMSRRPRPLTRRQRCVAACETTSTGAIYRPVDLLCSPIWLISCVLAFTFNSIPSRSFHLWLFYKIVLLNAKSREGKPLRQQIIKLLLGLHRLFSFHKQNQPFE